MWAGDSPVTNYVRNQGWALGPLFSKTGGTGLSNMSPGLLVPAVQTACIVMSLKFTPYSDGTIPMFSARIIRTATGLVLQTQSLSQDDANAGSDLVIVQEIEGDPLIAFSWELQINVDIDPEHEVATPLSGTLFLKVGGHSGWM